MKRIFSILAAASLSLAITVSSATASGEMLTDYREVSPFTAVAASGNVTIELKGGSKSQSVVVVGEESNITEVITEVRDGVLVLAYNGSLSAEPYTIIIESPNVRSVTLNDDNKAILSGITAPRFELSLSDNAEAIAKGKISNLTVKGSNNTVLKAKELQSEQATVQLTETAKAELTVNTSLTANTAPSAHLKYYGNAKLFNGEGNNTASSIQHGGLE